MSDFDGTLIHWRAATGVSDDPTVREPSSNCTRGHQRASGLWAARSWTGGRSASMIWRRNRTNPISRAGTAKVVRRYPAAARRRAIGALGLEQPRARRLLRQSGRSATDIRRAGGDRDHQRGDVSRVADPHERSSGIAGIPDRDQRRAEGHQPIDLRIATRIGYCGQDRRPICVADQAILNRREGDVAAIANFGFPPEYEAHVRALEDRFRPECRASQREPCSRECPCIFTIGCRSRLSRRIDRLGKQRPRLRAAVAGRRNDREVRARRQRVEPFTDRQIELVRTSPIRL